MLILGPDIRVKRLQNHLSSNSVAKQFAFTYGVYVGGSSDFRAEKVSFFLSFVCIFRFSPFSRSEFKNMAD